MARIIPLSEKCGKLESYTDEPCTPAVCRDRDFPDATPQKLIDGEGAEEHACHDDPLFSLPMLQSSPCSSDLKKFPQSFAPLSDSSVDVNVDAKDRDSLASLKSMEGKECDLDEFAALLAMKAQERDTLDTIDLLEAKIAEQDRQLAELESAREELAEQLQRSHQESLAKLVAIAKEAKEKRAERRGTRLGGFRGWFLSTCQTCHTELPTEATEFM